MSIGGNNGDYAFGVLCKISQELATALQLQGLTDAHEASKERLIDYWDPSLFDDSARRREQPSDVPTYWREHASKIAKKLGGQFPFPIQQ